MAYLVYPSRCFPVILMKAQSMSLRKTKNGTGNLRARNRDSGEVQTPTDGQKWKLRYVHING